MTADTFTLDISLNHQLDIWDNEGMVYISLTDERFHTRITCGLTADLVRELRTALQLASDKATSTHAAEIAATNKRNADAHAAAVASKAHDWRAINTNLEAEARQRRFELGEDD